MADEQTNDQSAPDPGDDPEGFLRSILDKGGDGTGAAESALPPSATPSREARFLGDASPMSQNIEDRRTTLNDDPSQPGRSVSSSVGKDMAPPRWITPPHAPGKDVYNFADGGEVPDDSGWSPVDPPAQTTSQDDGWAPVDPPSQSAAPPSSQDDGWAPVDAPPQAEGLGKMLVRKAANEAIPFAASLPAMGEGATLGAGVGTAVFPGPGTLVGGFLGAAAGGFLANLAVGGAQDKIKSMLGLDDSAQREVNAEAHSTAEFVADMVPAVAAFKVGKLAGSLGSRLANAAGMGGVDAAQQLLTNGSIDPKEVAEQAAVGGLFNEARFPGVMTPFSKGHAVEATTPGRPDLQGDQSAKDDAHVPPPPPGQPGVASDPVAPARRDVGDETGSDNQYPKDNALPTGNSASVSEGEMDPTIQAAVDSMAKPRPGQKPLPPRPDTGLEDVAPAQRPPAAQAAIDGQPPASPAQQNEGIPFMVTQAMKAQLAERGFSPEDIKGMTPAQAHENLKAPAPADESTPAPGETPPSAEQATNVEHPTMPGVQVERADLPPGYVARSDNAGTKVYLSKNVPETMDVNGHVFDPAEPLKVHEIYERRGIAVLQQEIAAGRHPPMSDDKIYDVVHQKVGTAAERAYLEEHVGTPEKPFTDADFAEYQRQMADVSRTQTGEGQHPADLYTFMDAHEAKAHLHTPAGAEVPAQEQAVSAQRPAAKKAPSGNSGDVVADALNNFGKPGAVTAAVKEAPGLKPVLKLIADHPAIDPAAKADLIAKMKTAPPEAVAKAYEGLRPRQRAAVEGLGVTARTKADAQRKEQALAAAKTAFDKHAPTKDVMPVGAAAAQEMYARLKAAVTEAGPEALAYKPRVQPAHTQWLREADKLVKKGVPTQRRMTEFAVKEKQLRSGNAEDARAVQADKRTEADISMSRRSGEEAVDHAQAQHIEPHAEEDRMQRYLDREGEFEVPHEEGEEGRTPEPVTSREDLARLDQGPSDQKPFDISKMSPEELDKLAEDMSKRPDMKVWKTDEEARLAAIADKSANLKALRLAKNGAKPLEPEVLKRAKFAWSEGQKERGARPTERAPEDVGGPAGRDFLDSSKLAKDGKLGVKPHPELGGAAKKILEHLGERYPKPGAWNTHNKSDPKDEYFASVHDGLHKLTQQDTAETTAIRQHIDTFPKELRENPARLERIYRAHEQDNLDSLDPQSRELYNKHLQPLFDRSNTLAAALRKIAPNKIGDYVKDHIQRLRKGYDPDLDVLTGLSGDPIAGVQGVSTARKGAMNDRVFSVLERKSDGARIVVGKAADGSGYTKWQGGIGTHVDAKGFEHKAGQAFSNHGIDYTMRDAYTDEIEKNAKFEDGKAARYYKNPILSAAMSVRDLGSQLRHLTFLARTADTPEFKANTTTNPKLAQEKGYVKTLMPQFEGTYMDPNLARVFDQYAKPGFDMPQWAHTASQMVTKMLFFLPVAHIANVGTHWFVGRGWDWINPKGYQRLALSSVKAIRSVMSQDADQLDLYKRGAALRLGSVLSKDTLGTFGKLAGEVISRSPEFPRIAKVLGVGAEELTKAIYDGSSRVMWAANDMFLTQQIMENQMKGMTKEMAIAHAERHIPNYRIPAALIGNGEFGRQFAKFMEDPVTSSFGRYHYGVFNSYATMVHDMLDPSSTGKQRVEAIGNVMALGVLAFMVKPALDAMAQVVTGNKDAEVHARGPLAVPASMARALRGQDDIMNTARNMASTPPAVATVLEAFHNKDFASRDIVKPGDVEMAAHGSLKAGGRALVGEADHTARGLVAPYNIAANAASKGQSPLQSARDQLLDINEKSQKALKYDRTQPAKAEHVALRAKPTGPMGALYDQMFGKGK